MQFIYDDGGRKNAGYQGTAGDCVTRAIAIATEQPYEQVYQALANGAAGQRASNRTGKQARSARNGIFTGRKWFKDYMAALGWKWVPTMFIGQGCKVHLRESELPSGRLIISVSRHYTAVIDGVIHDTHDPQRIQFYHADSDKQDLNGTRCVYGYWTKG